MENKKSLGAIGLVVICLAISALFGIAYAAFSKTLTISGSATVSPTTWNIGWKSMTQNTGSVAINNIPNITASAGTASISGWSTTFTRPDQKISFDITVKNYGSFNAKLTDVKFGESSIFQYFAGSQFNLVGDGKLISCSATDSTDALNVCSNLSVSVTNQSASTPVALEASNAKTLSNGCGESDSDCTETYRIEVEYRQAEKDTTGSQLPTGPVTITFGQMDFIYTQQN
ncbi:MAG: hypothetical protein K6G37_03125 [Bacilli bacterium]|nr:hypothetical protein [Bacilli bacterium]